METWAFGTSPHGLGLPEKRLWSLTPRQHKALCKVWRMNREFDSMAIAALRADIHNSSEMLQRQDKRRWTPQDFGAPGDGKTQSDGRPVPPTPVELRIEMIKKFGAPRDKSGKKKSVLSTLKGQTLPPRKKA